MKSLFKCLELFVDWLQGGLYDFNSLPFSVFKPLNDEDVSTVMQVYSCKLVFKFCYCK